MLLAVSYIGSFGGMRWLQFPYDVVLMLPVGVLLLCASQRCLVSAMDEEPGSAIHPIDNTI